MRPSQNRLNSKFFRLPQKPAYRCDYYSPHLMTQYKCVLTGAKANWPTKLGCDPHKKQDCARRYSELATIRCRHDVE